MCADIVAENFTWSFRLAPNSMESALIRRSMSALERIVSNASAHALSEALAASTDVGSLAQLLSRGDNVGTSIMELEPLAPSLARGVAHREQILQRRGIVGERFSDKVEPGIFGECPVSTREKGIK